MRNAKTIVRKEKKIAMAANGSGSHRKSSASVVAFLRAMALRSHTDERERHTHTFSLTRTYTIIILFFFYYHCLRFFFNYFYCTHLFDNEHTFFFLTFFSCGPPLFTPLCVSPTSLHPPRYYSLLIVYAHGAAKLFISLSLYFIFFFWRDVAFLCFRDHTSCMHSRILAALFFFAVSKSLLFVK